jgi:hypothetical protein
VPKLSSHEFWSQEGLAIEDGKPEDSVVVNIVAYGDSESEATGFAIKKLISIVDLARKSIAHSNRPITDFGIEQVRSLMIGSSRHVTSLNKQNCMFWEMAANLFDVYQNMRFLLIDIASWDAIARFIHDALEKYPSLEPLILYYKVLILLLCPVLRSAFVIEC